MAYKSIYGANTPTPSGLNSSGTGYRSVFNDAKSDVSTPLNAGIETRFYKSVFGDDEKKVSPTTTAVTQQFLDSFVYGKGLKMDTPALPQKPTAIPATPTAPKTEADYLLSGPGLKKNILTPELASDAKTLNSLAVPSDKPNVWGQIWDGLKGIVPGTAVTLPTMVGQSLNFAGGLLDTAKNKLDELGNSSLGFLEDSFSSTPLGLATNTITGRFNDDFARFNGLDPKDPNVQEALKIFKPSTYYKAAGQTLKTDADARMKAHPEWARPDYFYPDNDLDGVIKNLQEHPVAYSSRVISENTPQLIAQIGLALTTGSLGSMTFMGMSAGGDTYEDALKHGVPQDKAVFLASSRGMVEAQLEQLGLDKILGKGASSKLTTGFLGKLWSKVQEVGADVLTEGSTEAVQQLFSNAVAMTFDENRGLFDGVPSSFFAGGITAGPVSIGSKVLGIGTDVNGETLNQNIIPGAGVSGNNQEQPGTQVPNAPGSPTVTQPGVQADTTLGNLEEPNQATPSAQTEDIIQGITQAEINPPAQGFNATQSQPDSRVTDLPRVQIEGANQEGQSFVLNAADLRRIQGEKFITDDGQNLIEAPTTESALRVLDARTITDRDSNFVIKYQNTDKTAKEILEEVAPQGFDAVIDSAGRVAAGVDTLVKLQELARFKELSTKNELPSDLRDVIERYASVRDLTLAGDMVARRLESKGIDIPKTVAPEAIDLSNVNPDEVLSRLAEIQNGAQVAPMRVKLTAEGITLPNAQDNVTAAALRQMGQEIPVKISPTDLLNQVVKQFGYDNLKDYFDVREDVKAFRRGERSLPSFQKDSETKTTRISPTQAERIVRRYFGKDEIAVQFAKQLLTPKGERALGSYRGSIITFAQNPLESTPTHEVLHAYFDVFTSTARKEQVLREVMREYDITDRIEAEEILADEFVEFARGMESTKWTDIIRQFFGRVWQAMKTMVNRQSEVYALYNDIIAKRRPEGVQVSDEILSNAQMFQTEGDVTLKFFAMPEFTKRKDMLKEEAISLAKSGRAALKASEQNFIINVIEGYFPGAKRISMNDLKKALLTEALPLRNISLSKTEYDNYGLERAGVADIVDEKSVILNTPYHHGWTGHWTDEYSGEQTKLYKTIPGKDGTFLVVDAWVDPASEPSPFSIHKSGTQEEVDTWLAEHQGDKEAINKGLFSHYRVWRGEGYVFPLADKLKSVLRNVISTTQANRSFYGFLGTINESHPMSVLDKDTRGLSITEIESLIKDTIKALNDESALEASFERLKNTAKIFTADEGKFMNQAANWINADEQQDSMFTRTQLFNQWLEKNHPEMDKDAAEYLYERAVRVVWSDGYLDAVAMILEQNDPAGPVIENDFFRAAETLEKDYNDALKNEKSDSSYDSYIAEIQSDSFQEQKFKRQLGDIGGKKLQEQINDLSQQIREIEKTLEDPRDVKIPNEVLANAASADLTLTVPETSEAVSKRRSREFKSAGHKDRLLILARYKGLIPQWMVDVAKATGTDRDLPFRVFVTESVSRFMDKLAPGNKIEISTHEGVKNFSKDYLRGKLEDLKSERETIDEQLARHKASPDTAIKKEQEKAVGKFFAPFQDTWHERTIRQAIQDEARKGAKTINFPALTTIAKIEGFVSSNEDGTSEAFEEVYGADVSSTFEYGGRSWTKLKAEDGIIEAALEDYVETFDNSDIVSIVTDNTDSLVDDVKGELDTIKANFPNIYEEAGAKEFLAGREKASEISDLLGTQSALRGTKEVLIDTEKAIEDAESSSPELEALLDRKNYLEQRISGIEKIFKDKGINPTDEFSVPPKYVGIPRFLEEKTTNMIERIADGELVSEQAVDEQLREDIYDEERDSFDFPSYADSLGWEVFRNEDESTWLVIKRPAAAERREFESSDFESSQLDENASEETFAKTYKESLDGDQKGVVYFYDAKVIPYLKKLRKDNLELVEIDGSWWYQTKVTPEDTGPVTMFQVDKTADQIVAENLVKGVPTVKQAINLAIKGEKSPAKLKTEEQLLKDSLRAQRRVARSIVKNTQQRLAEQFANKLADIRKVKTYLTEYLKMLPLNERGKMITLVRDAETIFDLAKAAIRVNAKFEEVQKKDIIADIRKAYNRILESPGVDVGFKAQVSGLFNEIQIQGKSPATMERLNKLRTFIQTRQENGQPVYIQSRLLRQLEILDKTPIKEIPVEQLDGLLDEMEALEDQGRTKVEIRERLYRREVERIAEAVTPELIPIDKPEFIKATPGQKLTKEEHLKNVATSIKRSKLYLGKAWRPMDVFFDMFSGGKGLYNTEFYRRFKGRIDSSFQSYLQEKDRLIEPISKLADELKLDAVEMDRIGTYAQLKQEGGLDKLIQLGFKQAELEQIKLTERETQFYDAVRAKFTEIYPDLKEYMARVYNKDIGSVENYFPMVTDWGKMDEVEMFNRFGEMTQETGSPKKNIIAGSTYERKRGAKQKIVTNALTAYKRHMDNAIYMLEMGETIRTLTDATKTEGFREAIGDYGYLTLREYLDLLARKGGVETTHRLAWLDYVRRNMSVAVMGFKVSSALVQPGAFFDGASAIGMGYAMSGVRSFVDPDWQQFAYDHFPEFKSRIGDDPAFADMDENQRLKKLRETSMSVLQHLDAWVAGSIALGAYEKYANEHDIEIDPAKPNKDAIAYAQVQMRRTQGSAFFKDSPLMLSRGAFTGNRSIDRAVGAFQSFMLNKWSYLNYDIKEKLRNNPKAAANAAIWLMAAQMYQVFAQGFTRDMLSLIGGEPEEDPFFTRFLRSILGNIPIVSQLFSAIEYDSNPVPVIANFEKVMGGVGTLANPSTKPATKTKAAVRTAAGVGTIFGIPGSAQAADIILRTMDRE